MLVEFKAKNYKSFRDEMIFSMVPTPRITGLDYSIVKTKIKSKFIKTLSSAVIYGPNAAGKSNAIGAMETFKNILLRGNIRNASPIPNYASSNLELIPFMGNEKEEPITFEIAFIEKAMFFRYALSFLVGRFYNDGFERKILSERLEIDNNVVFVRNEEEIELSFSAIRQWVNGEKLQANANVFAENSLNSQELFLMNGFKTVISQRLVEIIRNWLENKLKVIYRADSILTHKLLGDDKTNFIEVDRVINEAAKMFGINSNAVGYLKEQDDNDTKLVSIFKDIQKILPANLFESYGTVRFINEFPIILSALANGETLVIDEFDASIHPMALMSLINVFHNNTININHAQLIFNTHNPIFLNANLFRRDEIKFVERDDETGESELYQLSDFGTSGKPSVRKGEDYLKNYFVNRYGAIKDIDFAPLFAKIIKPANEE